MHGVELLNYIVDWWANSANWINYDAKIRKEIKWICKHDVIKNKYRCWLITKNRFGQLQYNKRDSKWIRIRHFIK